MKPTEKRRRLTLALLALALFAVPLVLWAWAIPEVTIAPGLTDSGTLTTEPQKSADVATMPGDGEGKRVPASDRSVSSPLGLNTSAAGDPEDWSGPHLSGRVLTVASRAGASRPIVGASLTYGPSDKSELDFDEWQTGTTTDIEGRFELAIAAVGMHSLTISADGFLPHVVQTGPVLKDMELGDVMLANASMVSGQAVDRAGRAIEDVRIIMVDPCSDDLRPSRGNDLERVLAITDESGKFKVPASAQRSPGVLWTLGARHENYRPAIHQGKLDTGSRELRPILITMDSGAAIHGRVSGLSATELEAEGPLAVGVASRLQLDMLEDDWAWDQSMRRVVVAPDGTFTIGGLRPQESLALAIWTGGSGKSITSRRRSLWHIEEARLDRSSREAMELTYLRPVRVLARAIDESGRPLERLYVNSDVDSIVLAGGSPRPDQELSVYPDGQVEWVFRAGDLEDGPTVTIEVEDEISSSWKAWSAAIPSLSAGELHSFGDVVLADVEISAAPAKGKTRTIEVQVVDRHGEPLAGAPVDVADAATDRGRVHFRRTDEQGRATFDVPAEQDFNVRVAIQSARDWIESRHRGPTEHEGVPHRTLVPAGDSTESLHLTAPESAGLTITASYGGEPLSGACLVLRRIPASARNESQRRPRDGTPEGVRTGGDGTWSSDAILPGDWRAWVYHPQLRMPESFEFTVAPGDNEVHLERSRSGLEGRVLDDGGIPISGALVRAEEAEISPLLAIHERDSHRMSPRLGGSKEGVALRDIRFIRTDENGYFRLDGVEPECALKVVVMAPGFVLVTSSPRTVAAGTLVDVGDLQMLRGGRLEVVLPLGMEGDINMEPVVADEGEDDGESAPFVERWSSIYDRESIEGLAPGRWDVHIVYRSSTVEGDWIKFRETREIRAGETTRVDLRPE